MIVLKGMTWRHKRGVAPLLEAAKAFQKIRPDVTVLWDSRSLEDFEAYPVEILAENYDLMMIDHPFIGSAVEKGVILPLDEWLSADYLSDQKMNSVGQSYQSYTWNGKQWALAVDAAAQVSAYRKDLLDQLGMNVPVTWDEVFALIDALPGGMKVGIPLNPVHSFSSFIAVCVHLGGSDFWDHDRRINPEVGAASLEFLKNLVPRVHERSLDFNPIAMSDRMAETNEIVYIPLIFGYSNYAREGFRTHLIHYTNIPSKDSVPKGGLLGGVGLAVSAKSRYKKEAVELARLIGSPEFQKGTYFESGGQPGYRGAWTDPDINKKANGFFIDTLLTLEYAYMRPRKLGSVPFQEKAGVLINRFLQERGDSRQTMAEVNRLYQQYVVAGVRQ